MRSAWKIVAVALGLASMMSSAHAQMTKMTIGAGVDPSFSAFFVAKSAGIFEKNGLDVTVKTGPSGSAMVAYVIQNQIQAAFGAEVAGIQDFNLDGNVVTIGEGALMPQYYGFVGRNISTLEEAKGKKIGIARGSASEVFWLAMIEKLKLNAKDYNIVQVDAPEMIAALERGNIDGFTCWEPWLTRAVMSVPNTKILKTSEGIMSPRVYVYLNRGWAEKNRLAALAFVRSLIEANARINKDPDAEADLVSTFLKLDKDLTKALMRQVRFDLRFDNGSVENFVLAHEQLKQLGKLAKPVAWDKFLYSDLLKELSPEKVAYSLPK